MSKQENMIKTYRYNVLCNSASHILNGVSGNSMRYEFTHGNIAGNKYPEITLRNKYAQDLLESHELFQKGKVSLIRKVLEESDIVDESVTKPATEVGNVENVESVRSADELITYVNQRWDKKFILPKKAIDFAAKENVAFPNYKPE